MIQLLKEYRLSPACLALDRSSTKLRSIESSKKLPNFLKRSNNTGRNRFFKTGFSFRRCLKAFIPGTLRWSIVSTWDFTVRYFFNSLVLRCKYMRERRNSQSFTNLNGILFSGVNLNMSVVFRGPYRYNLMLFRNRVIKGEVLDFSFLLQESSSEMLIMMFTPS